MTATRTRPLALDGHSLDAELSVDRDTLAKVEVVVLDIVRRVGPATDDVIDVLYASRVENYPGVPRVTSQRVRTARASLVRKGLIVADPLPGSSILGNKATRWVLAKQKAAA